MDIDDSGRISYKEFAQLVRHELSIGKAEVPPAQLQSLWRALDENESGFICAGEFGRFMRVANDVAPLDVVAEAKERQRQEEIAQRARKSAMWKASAAQRAHASAKHLAAEAAALEAALTAAKGGHALPPISGVSAGGGSAAALEMLKRASSKDVVRPRQNARRA